MLIDQIFSRIFYLLFFLIFSTWFLIIFMALVWLFWNISLIRTLVNDQGILWFYQCNFQVLHRPILWVVASIYGHRYCVSSYSSHFLFRPHHYSQANAHKFLPVQLLKGCAWGYRERSLCLSCPLLSVAEPWLPIEWQTYQVKVLVFMRTQPIVCVRVQLPRKIAHNCIWMCAKISNTQGGFLAPTCSNYLHTPPLPPQVLCPSPWWIPMGQYSHGIPVRNGIPSDPFLSPSSSLTKCISIDRHPVCHWWGQILSCTKVPILCNSDSNSSSVTGSNTSYNI